MQGRSKNTAPSEHAPYSVVENSFFFISGAKNLARCAKAIFGGFDSVSFLVGRWIGRCLSNTATIMAEVKGRITGFLQKRGEKGLFVLVLIFIYLLFFSFLSFSLSKKKKKKKKKKGLVKSFKRRWFVFDSNEPQKKVFYYHSPESKEELGSIVLSQVEGWPTFFLLLVFFF